LILSYERKYTCERGEVKTPGLGLGRPQRVDKDIGAVTELEQRVVVVDHDRALADVVGPEGEAAVGAGLVVEEPQGTRRIYRLQDQGIEAVQAYLTHVWGDAIARFRLTAENITPARAGAPKGQTRSNVATPSSRPRNATKQLDRR